MQNLKQQISVLTADSFQILLFVAKEGSVFLSPISDDSGVEMKCETSPHGALEDRLFEQSLLGVWRRGRGGRISSQMRLVKPEGIGFAENGYF